eukprot:2444671-Alexandrium_andersonii.AAC.1
MSASLVGSEMCIRDRPGRGRRLRLPLAGRALRQSFSLLQRPLGRTPPVSYTHLTLPTICSV